jgi:hypothetical protein
MLARGYERGRLRCLRKHCCTYDFTSLAAAFRTFAQRSFCASAIRLRASLLKVRPVFLSVFPLAWPRASSAFPTCPISFSRREYSFRREATTLFIIIKYPLAGKANTARHLVGISQKYMRRTSCAQSRSGTSLQMGNAEAPDGGAQLAGANRGQEARSLTRFGSLFECEREADESGLAPGAPEKRYSYRQARDRSRNDIDVGITCDSGSV